MPVATEVRVLVLEDDDLDFTILQRHLETVQSPAYKLVRAADIDEARQAISSDAFDAALVDYRLSGGVTGLDFVTELGGRDAPFPIVLLTGMNAGELDKKAILSGAYDYIDKMALTRELADRALRFSISSHQYERQLRVLITEANTQANINRRVLSIVSHEMNTQVGSLIRYCDYIMENSAAGENRDAAANMKAASLHLEDLLANLSEFVRLDSGATKLSKQAFHLKTILDETVEVFQPYARHKEISLIADFGDTTDETFIGDRMRIRQVLINLIKNAITYSDKGTVAVCAAFDGERLCVSVRDEGTGMSEETVETILSDAVTPHTPGEDLKGGLGIGLSICRRLLQLMGGELAIESAEGSGTTVRFNTPLERKANSAAA